MDCKVVNSTEVTEGHFKYKPTALIVLNFGLCYQRINLYYSASIFLNLIAINVEDLSCQFSLNETCLHARFAAVLVAFCIF